MAFQFPADPTLGQVYNAAPGIQYTWNGTGWAPTTAVANVAEGLFPDGTLAAPAISWLNEPNSGFYRNSNRAFYSVVNGVMVWSWSPSLFSIDAAVTLSAAGPSTLIGQTKHGSGSLAAPAISWNAEATSGWYRRAAGDFGLSIGGVLIGQYHSTFVSYAVPVVVSNNNLTAKQIYADNGAGMAMYGADISYPRIRFTADNWRLEFNVGAGLLSWLNPSGVTSFCATNNGTLTAYEGVHINNNSPAIVLNKTATSTEGSISWRLNGVTRWYLACPTSEPNSNWSVVRTNAAGAYVDQPLQIRWSDGQVILARPIVAADVNLNEAVEELDARLTELNDSVRELGARFKALEALPLGEMSARVKLLERRLT